ncbi:helix-turn-helix transcriptional regulator [Marimonas lutisalis]|uniref:helix-turn-helix transcriptional regulator n=1 Tax=Marimonas lutisalis TaxID=2545756 RepID=UPI0010F447E5|nr:helix-turn-helix transcriptional regulator [Marimonas lutisalis]
MKGPNIWMIAGIVIVQGLCAVFFVSDIMLNVIGARAQPISWQTREMLEIGAALGLVLGMVLGWIAYRRTWARSRQAEQKLRAASGAFLELLEEHFESWGLTPAERDVALFAVKGLSTAEIAGLRNTSEGTVKAQTNAIYRKAGVSGRPQLLSLFIEDLMDEALLPDTGDGAAAATSKAAS